MASKFFQPKVTSITPKITDIEKIVDYSFEKNEKSNVLAIHPTRSFIAYLINIQRTQKISKAWSSGDDSMNSPSSSAISGQNLVDKNRTVSIRIIDYVTRQRCLAKGIYYAKPADCAFTINSILCTQSDIIKLAVVDRVAVIRAPGQDVSPYESISLVWCPFVPCEDFDDGDGGLRLALATNTKIEIFAIDRLQGKTGDLYRNELRGAYKCIADAQRVDIKSISISPDCSTISSAAIDNRVTFFSSDIDDCSQKPLHNWEASISDGSSISKLFFLDDYPKLLEDSTMKFWGTAFIGASSGLMLLVNLRTWTVYHKTSINPDTPGPKNFDYRMDLTSRNVIAMNGNQCYVVQIESDHSKIVRTTRLALHNPVYSFVIKHKSDEELELFTISAYSLERYTIDLTAATEEVSMSASLADLFNLTNTSINYQAGSAIHTPTTSLAGASVINASGAPSTLPPSGPTAPKQNTNLNNTTVNSFVTGVTDCSALSKSFANDLDIGQMDRLVEALFTKLNTTFSRGLDEFLTEIKSEVNDLTLKLNGLNRDVRKLQRQLQDFRPK